jgi:hypothetical protein
MSSTRFNVSLSGPRGREPVTGRSDPSRCVCGAVFNDLRHVTAVGFDRAFVVIRGTRGGGSGVSSIFACADFALENCDLFATDRRRQPLIAPFRLPSRHAPHALGGE